MKEIIKDGKIPEVHFKCKGCGTAWKSNEYKIHPTRSTADGHIVYYSGTDTCPKCSMEVTHLRVAG